MDAIRRYVSPRPVVLWSLIGLAAALSFARWSPAQAQNGPTLGRIQVVGVQTVRPEQVLAWSGLTVDTPVSRETVASAIRSLYATGKFRDVFVYETTPQPGVRELILNLTEYPRLSEIRFEGSNKLDREDLLEGLNLRVGNFLSPASIRRAINTVRDKYRAEGYYNAEVGVAEGLLQMMGSQPLVFTIDEKRKVQVRRIVFEGNENLDDESLRGVMSTKLDNWWRSGTFKAPKFEVDLEAVVQRYADEGHLDARVLAHEIIFLEDDPNHIEIQITVEEGPQYTVGEISFSGNEVFDTELLMPLVVIRTGEIFRDKDFQESQRNVQSLYWDDGYIYSTLAPQRNIGDGGVVDVEFMIREGEQARIRKVIISGNTKTREEVIRREMRILPGDLFANSELRNSQGDLFRLGFFQDVQVDFEQTSEPDKIDLVFDVEEKQTGQFTMGVGFSQQTSTSGFFNIGENNFLGRGQSLQFAWQFGSRRNFLNLSFTEPWFMGTPTLVGADVFDRFSNRIQDFYDTRQRGFAIRLGRPVPGARFTRAQVRYSYNQTRLTNFDPFYIDTLENLERELGAGGVQFQRLDQIDWPQTEIGVTTSIIRNSQNNPFFPTGGSRASLRHELNGGLFGGDLDYQRLTVDYDWYQAMPFKLAFHVSASSGHLLAYGDTDAVPDYVRFRLGGNRFFKLRGYSDLEVVPRDNPSFVGGRFYTTFTTEIAYPLANAVHVLGFVDQGDTWNSFDEADLTNLRTGAGFGVRLEVPLVGRIGLDYGYGFDKDGIGDDPGWTAHFNFGQFF